MSNKAAPSPAHTFTFLHKFKVANTIYGDVLLNGEKVMDFIANADYIMPQGLYTFVQYKSPHFRRIVLLLEVPGHSFIEVHPADRSSELRGCFAVGSMCNHSTMDTLPYSVMFAEANSNAWLDRLIQIAEEKDVWAIEVKYQRF
jgi:Family of unknown function (DUF5675)